MVYPAKDACDCLEITNVSQACQTLDEDEKGITKGYTLFDDSQIESRLSSDFSDSCS